jgi:hypothetical protein
MATSYPDRTNARGIWRLSDITRNIKTEGTFPNASGRALFLGGHTGSASNVIDFIEISSTGDATDFGDLTVARRTHGSFSNTTRSITANGNDPAVNTIEYVHFSTTGNAADFGDAQNAIPSRGGSMCNSTRGIWGGGDNNPNSPRAVNTLDYITLASLGNAADFGDLSVARWGAHSGIVSSPIRGIAAGGATPTHQNVIDYVTINTTGNAADFGDLTETKYGAAGGSSSTRALIGGGESRAGVDTIQIASTGNAVKFGDLAAANNTPTAVSSHQRTIFGGGNTGSVVNVMQYFTISSAGNSTDFGDLSVARDSLVGNSTNHGGLEEAFPRAPELYSPTGRPVVHGDTAGLGDIGLFQSGGFGYVKTIDYIMISSASNGTDFGDTATSGTHQAGAGSSTRAFQACFASPGLSTNIDYGLFSTKGNHADFGDTTDARDKAGALSNNTRACWLGGRDNTSNDNVVNVIDYITMATIGNASDFGDLTAAKNQSQGLASNTRGVVGGGATPSEINVIEYITIASTSNATDFGDLSVTRSMGGGTGASSTTRGVFAGGTVPGGSNSDVIDYITISSTGNATDFGDLAFVTSFASGLSNNTRAVFSGFNNTSAPGANTTFGQTPHISYVTIASTGDITNFGDLSEKRYGLAAASNGHGGLS